MVVVVTAGGVGVAAPVRLLSRNTVDLRPLTHTASPHTHTHTSHHTGDVLDGMLEPSRGVSLGHFRRPPCHSPHCSSSLMSLQSGLLSHRYSRRMHSPLRHSCSSAVQGLGLGSGDTGGDAGEGSRVRGHARLQALWDTAGACWFWDDCVGSIVTNPGNSLLFNTLPLNIPIVRYQHC